MASKHRGSPGENRALDAYVKLQRASDTVLARTTGHLADHHLSISQFGVLEALYHLGTLSQRDLAAKLLRSTGDVSVVLKNLEKRGLIARERNPDDLRYMQVCITEAGSDLLLRFWGAHVRGIVEEMSVLTAAEQAELARLCRKLGLRDSSA
jgi:MarR family 2-MHQ and catechol resistance regulon transcriptional repressor